MQYIDYLEYVLKNLNENFSRGFNIDDIKSYYNKASSEKIDNETQRHFEKLYENKFIEKTGNSRVYKIIPEIKVIIDNYGSLSAYLELLENERLKKENEDNELKNCREKILNYKMKILNFQRQLEHKNQKLENLN